MLPLLATDKDKTSVVMEQVAFVLPSCMLHECQKKGRMSNDVYGASGFSSLYEYWKQDDQKWIIKQGFRDSMATTIPLNFHEDAVPAFREESYSFWSWMLGCA